MSIGERISDLRKGSKMSQGQLADALGVTRQAVSKWENDLAVPDALKMIQLADILDTDIEYLSTGRRNFARRPPVVLTEVKVVEKIVEKPVVQIVEKPVAKPVYRVKYRSNPMELFIVGGLSFVLGLMIGFFVF